MDCGPTAAVRERRGSGIEQDRNLGDLGQWYPGSWSQSYQGLRTMCRIGWTVYGRPDARIEADVDTNEVVVDYPVPVGRYDSIRPIVMEPAAIGLRRGSTSD